METRPDGTQSPIFNTDGSLVLHKQYLEQKHTIDAKLAQQRAQIAQGALNPNG
jgi:hypothetical protein